MAKTTVLLYGRTRAGKSTQVGELAEFEFSRTGKKTRLYTVDKGGIGPIQPYVDLGLVEIVAQELTDPWIFLNKAVTGHVRDKDGRWVKDINDKIGVYAFESMTGFADVLMTSLAEKAAQGINIGGSANVSFNVQGDNESLKIGGSNMAHYNIVQTRITNEVWESQKLPGDYIIWTASASKDDDPNSSGKVLGPAVVGKALTSEVPRWFNLTFRIDCIPAQQGKPERHVLYLGNSVDVGAGNAVSLGNTRLPMDAPEAIAKTSVIEPASLRKALELLEGGHTAAVEAIKRRLGTKNVPTTNTVGAKL